MRFKIQVFFGAVTAIVIAAIIAALVLIGSPSEQRKLRFDEHRVQDLIIIESEVRHYWTTHDELPTGLGSLVRPGVRLPDDPQTGKPYEYKALGDMRYELCARFETDTSDAPPWQGPAWRHGVGRTCFEKELDKTKPAAG